ncbi:MAG TPA: cytochrome c [Candidatus Binatia bacterium]|nr:cytochrome c [Candidatus Binatia bacterium]
MRLAVVLLAISLAGAAGAAAPDGARLYADACASCHGADGRGAPAGSGLTVPLPDFTDCNVATAETTANWAGLVRGGGPFLGMSPEMPAFAGVLDEDEIAAVLAHVRGFCRDPRWPIGDLNYRRPVFMDKAFPEDEVVAFFEADTARHERAYAGQISIEKRIGPRGQLELVLPGEVVDVDGAATVVGGGDLAVAYKHVLAAGVPPRTIVSAALEVSAPTGNRRHGVGSGTTVVTPQLLSGHAIGPLDVQALVEANLPADPDRADRAMRYRVAVQLPLGPYRRSVAPGVELEQSHALASDVHAATLLGPALYLPLSRRGHVALGVAGQVPVAGRSPFDWRLGAFLLWDWADGPFWAW